MRSQDPEDPKRIKKVERRFLASLAESGLQERSKKQRRRYGFLYFLLVFVVILACSFLLRWPVSYLNKTAGNVIFWLVLCGLFLLWTAVAIPKSQLNVPTNAVIVIKVMGNAFRLALPGKNWLLWPVESLESLLVHMKQVELAVEEKVEIRGSEPKAEGQQRTEVMGGRSSAYDRVHPSTWITVSLKATFIVEDLWRFLYKMPHEDLGQKKETLGTLIKDYLQSLINAAGMNLDDVLTLAGSEILSEIRDRTFDGQRFDDQTEAWGVSMVSTLVDETSLSEVGEEAMKLDFQGYMKGRSFIQEVRWVAQGLFNKPVEELTAEELIRLSSHIFTKGSIEAVQASDKFIFGSPEEIKKAIQRELVAEKVSK